jgi:transketolase
MKKNIAPIQSLHALTRSIRARCLSLATVAGSGHPTSSLSAADLMTVLFFGGYFRYDPDRPEHPNNDRLIFSKGHASPLFYALWGAAGRVTEEDLRSYRHFGSELEGHPTPHFPYAEAATGSLGQGLAIGVGLALNARRLDHLDYRTYVLLGDSEMSEGSQWEALQLAAYYQLDNLVGVLDINRLGQSGPTMLGHDVATYERRIAAFGWHTISIDGHDLDQIADALHEAGQRHDGRPTMILARTIKGRGISFLEDADHWHGKPLDDEQLERALAELHPFDLALRAELELPGDRHPASPDPEQVPPPDYGPDDQVATRAAYGRALKRLAPAYPDLVALDAEVSNSTKSEMLQEAQPNRFFEMFIAEQAMVGIAQGLAARGRIPFVSTFSAFLSRAFDQIRMSQYSDANIKFVGSHAGVSIGEDGPSQMGLEDMAMFRSIPSAVVLHPADAMATERLVEQAAEHRGIVYLRTLRQKTPILYARDESFPIGGCKILREAGDHDVATIVAAGATVHEALSAYHELIEEGIEVRVVDLYCIQPLDKTTIRAAAEATGKVITVEDHYPAGGLGEAVLAALADRPVPTEVLAVRRRPMSGSGGELRDFEGISAGAIVAAVKRHLGPHHRTFKTSPAAAGWKS